jgi:hypothetical protein
MNRFHKTEHGTRRKYITKNDIIYQIDVSNELWESVSSTKITNHIRYWSKYPDTTLKYGTSKPVESIPNYQEHTCTICDKKYKTRKGLLKHIKTKHSDPKKNISSLEITTQNQENYKDNKDNIRSIVTDDIFDISEYEDVKPGDKIGFVYCFSCESMPGIYKVGMTSRDVEKRLSDANKSSTWKPPNKYTHIMSKRVCNPYKKEKLIHKLLDDSRVNKKREFFKIDYDKLKCLFALLTEANTE